MPARPSRPRPGSARATIRVPTGAEEIKAKIGELHNALLQIRSFRKNLNKGFFDIGAVLREIQQRKLYEAKGYGSFEAFLEREIDLGKTTALKLIKISVLFVKAGRARVRDGPAVPGHAGARKHRRRAGQEWPYASAGPAIGIPGSHCRSSRRSVESANSELRT